MRSDPAVYRFCLAGELEAYWAEWLGGLALERTGAGETILTGTIADQAALHGLLNKIRDLGLTLLSIERLDGEPQV